MRTAMLVLGLLVWISSAGAAEEAGAGGSAASLPSTESMPCHLEGLAPAVAEAPALPAPEVVAGRIEVPDLLLTDQDGRSVRFYRDLVAGRVVAVNFIFTTCTTICPPMGAHFAKLERALAERPLTGQRGTPVALISVSIDPATDTPARLKAWREALRGDGERGSGGAGGWTLVTGPRQEMTALLKALGAYSPDKARHTPFLLVGNEAMGQWRRVYGLTPPAELAKLLDELTTPANANASAPTKGDAP